MRITVHLVYFPMSAHLLSTYVYGVKPVKQAVYRKEKKMLKSTYLGYILKQVTNLVQLVSSLGLFFAASLCSNSVLFSSFQPFLIIIRALNHNQML